MKGWKMAIAMVGVVLVVVLLRGCVTTSYLIPSSGMENSLYRGECILVNKWSYGLRLPFMKLWGYHRWADSPVQKEDILVFITPILLFLILKYVSLAIRIYIFLNISQVPLCMLSNSQHRGNFSFLFNGNL